MRDDLVRALREALRLRESQLELIAAIDGIRDMDLDAEGMLAEIAGEMTRRLDAEACLLLLLDAGTGALELRACHGEEPQAGRVKGLLTAQFLQKAARLERLEVMEEGGLHLMVTPIILGSDRRLGAVLAARAGRPFGPGEKRLLKTAEDQIDSAVMQGFAKKRLRQSTQELETVFRIDRIRDKGLPLDRMLDEVIREMSAVIRAEAGFVMLYDRAGQELKMRASTHRYSLETLPDYRRIEEVVQESLKRATLICRNDVGGAVRSIMCLPLILNDHIIGVLGMINRDGAVGFTEADRRLLQAIGSQIDTAIYERSEIRLLRQVLGRAMDSRVLERMLSSPDVGFLKGELLELTVLYADLRGSTALAERTEPERLVEFIKDYLSLMSEVILKHEGTIDKFVGDEVMALFGAPVPREGHALVAVRVGLDMQTAYRTLRERWRSRDFEPPPMGVGIATGEMIAGEMGGPQRAQYTVIGRAANLGSRICSAARGDQVLISQRTFDLIGPEVEAVPYGGQQFRGLEEDVTVYEVRRILSRGGEP